MATNHIPTNNPNVDQMVQAILQAKAAEAAAENQLKALKAEQRAAKREELKADVIEASKKPLSVLKTLRESAKQVREERAIEKAAEQRLLNEYIAEHEAALRAQVASKKAKEESEGTVTAISS